MSFSIAMLVYQRVTPLLNVQFFIPQAPRSPGGAQDLHGAGNGALRSSEGHAARTGEPSAVEVQGGEWSDLRGWKRIEGLLMGISWANNGLISWEYHGNFH